MDALVNLMVNSFAPALWGLERDYTLRNVVLGSAIIGASSGAFGSFATRRRPRLLGGALAQAASLGDGLVKLMVNSFEPAVWGLEMDYTLRNVVRGSAIIGAIGGAVGSFATLRRQSLLGDALAHAALPGVCLAYLLTGAKTSLGLMVG